MYTVCMKKLFLLFLVAIQIILPTPVVFAQEVPCGASNELSCPPFQVFDEEQRTEVDDDAFPGYKVYDIYERAVLVVQDFPFGYLGVSEYKWWPNNYLEEDGYYGPRKMQEVGYLYKNEERSAEYKIIYDENEKIISKESDGLSAVRIFAFLIYPFLGLTKGEIDKEVNDFFEE